MRRTESISTVPKAVQWVIDLRILLAGTLLIQHIMRNSGRRRNEPLSVANFDEDNIKKEGSYDL